MFIDEIKIYARAGHGGKGCVAFQREAIIPRAAPAAATAGAAAASSSKADHDLNNLIAQYYHAAPDRRRTAKPAWAKAWTATPARI